MRVWILGSGLIGGGWALVFAAAGHEVTVIDPDPQAPARLAALFSRAVPDMRALGLRVATDSPPPVVAAAAAVGPAPDWVQESLPEKLGLKQQALAEIEPLIGADTIIASSSSGLSPDDMAAGLAHPGRLVIAHPCNPSHLMPVVELCGGTATPPAVMDRAAGVFQAMGKTVLRMNRAMPGHLVNRLQAALWREAVFLAAEGVASLGDIERAVTQGLAPRWTILGPSAVFHVSGGDGGMERFLTALGPEFERWWTTLGAPRLDEATGRTLVRGMAEADPRPVAEIAADRDARLVRIMQYLRDEAAGNPNPAPGVGQ
ncbi:MAG: 3-hydroxyacyl-CoA dehydrogenase NAD-binding domain-containing protein [Paracoccaceae bacterium]